MSYTKDEFWEHLRLNSERLEHALNLSGKTTAKCEAPKCKNGTTESGHDDWDGNGRYWVEAVQCRACAGRGRVEVACSPELESKAIKIEIARLQGRLRDLRKVKRARPRKTAL